MARKRRPVRRHQVKASMQVLELNNAGSSMELEVYEAGEKLGHIILGRGSLTWFGANRQKSKRWSWGAFAKMMNMHAYGDEG
jgi:hypothetical protein